jgi:hypothetical protein
MEAILCENGSWELPRFAAEVGQAGHSSFRRVMVLERRAYLGLRVLLSCKIADI